MAGHVYYSSFKIYFSNVFLTYCSAHKIFCSISFHLISFFFFLFEQIMLDVHLIIIRRLYTTNSFININQDLLIIKYMAKRSLYIIIYKLGRNVVGIPPDLVKQNKKYKGLCLRLTQAIEDGPNQL